MSAANDAPTFSPDSHSTPPTIERDAMHYLIMWQGQRSPVRLATRHAGEAFASRLRQLGARNVIVFPAYGPPVSRRPQPLKEEPAERVSVYAPLTIAPWRL